MGAEQQTSIFDDPYFEERHARARRVFIVDAFTFILMVAVENRVDPPRSDGVRGAIAAGRITIFSLNAVLLIPFLWCL